MRTRRTRNTGILLALLLALGALSADAWAAEDGNTVEIATEAELIAFRDTVNAEASSTLNARLTEDITLTRDWTPIYPSSGYITEAYAGVFDGCGHSVKGLSIQSADSYQGLFGAINGAVIKNLTVEGTVSAANLAGGLVGKVQQGTVENCGFSGHVTATKSGGYAGGITGYAGNTKDQTASVTGCFNTGTVTGSYAGGVVGYAKYTAITSCYNTGTINGTTRAGGIAGQLQNNCTAKACYNAGEIGGSATAADICDFLYSSAALENCYFQTRASGAGTGTGQETCEEIGSLEGLLEKLGADFAADDSGVNGGYPILSWQASGTPSPKDPHITITGGDTLYMTNSGAQPSAALAVEFTDTEETKVQWSVLSGGELIDMAPPQNPAENDHIRIVTAVKPGKAVLHVETEDGAYEDDFTLNIIPYITALELNGTPCAGEPYRVTVYVYGGGTYDDENYPELTGFSWAYYDAPTGGSATAIPGTGSTVSVPPEAEGKYLTVKLYLCGETMTPNSIGGYRRLVTDADSAAVANDKAALTLDVSEVRENMTLVLPVQGENGCVIVWESSDPEVISPSGRVTLPQEESVTVTLTAALSKNGKSGTKEFPVRVWSVDELAGAAAEETLRNAAAALGGGYRLCPIWGVDGNVNEMVSGALAEKGYEGVSVSVASVREVYGGGGIGPSGEITYFYADPNSAPALKMASCQVTFTLSYGGAAYDLDDVPVTLYWDAARVKEAMEREILAQVELDTQGPLPDRLSLPKVVDGKRWTLISWSSSNEEAVSISGEDQTTADTLFAPYVGVVSRGETAETVLLTAQFSFQLTNDVIGSEAPIVLYKTFELTVPPVSGTDAAETEARLLAKLDAGFAAKGLTDAVTGEALTPVDGVYTTVNDIQLPTTHDFGVDGKYYPVTITSDDARVVKAPDTPNAARVEVYRPAVGEPGGTATVTVTIHDRDTAISASRSFLISVPTLTQEEIDGELALMERVKAAFFEGIRGENRARDEILTDLSPFQEVYEENGELVWVRTAEDRTGRGIVPTPMEGWEELEAWRLFKSSNPAVISHEDLRVDRQENAKAVTITAYLSSERLGRYGQLYQSDPGTYARYAAMAELYYQPVNASMEAPGARARAAVPGMMLLVRGTGDPESTTPVTETVSVSFTLRGLDETWIDTVELAGLDETWTAYDVLNKVLSERGYRFVRERGSYVSAVEKPDGTVLREKDMGENSGWLYAVNRELPNVYMGACGLHNGDEIVVYYMADASEDNPDWDWPSHSAGSDDAGSDDAGSDDAGSNDAGSNDAGSNDAGSGDDESVGKGSPVSDGMAQQEGTADRRQTFADVDADAWYASAVDFVSGRELLLGVGGEAFAPDRTLSRGMLVTALFRLEEPGGVSAAGLFSDVTDGVWYAQGVAWAAESGIVLGYGDGRFGPEHPITREQLALILYRYADSAGMSMGGRDSLTGFADRAQVSPWASEAVAWAVDNGIIRGRGDGLLAPAGTASRAEAAVMLQRLVILMLRG